MDDPSIIFRAVSPEDITNIRRLLHANSRCWDERLIAENSGTLYLLSYQRKVLGVLCGIHNADKTTIDWIEVHHMFSEKMIREIMTQEFKGIFWRTIPQTHRSAPTDLSVSPQPT